MATIAYDPALSESVATPVCVAPTLTAVAPVATKTADPSPEDPGESPAPLDPPAEAGRIEAGSLPDFGRTTSLPFLGDLDALKPSTEPAFRA